MIPVYRKISLVPDTVSRFCMQKHDNALNSHTLYFVGARVHYEKLRAAMCRFETLDYPKHKTFLKIL